MSTIRIEITPDSGGQITAYKHGEVMSLVTFECEAEVDNNALISLLEDAENCIRRE